ncbi:glutamate receptor 2.7-like [Telopea speciosissima]|uniref:glutamate receptor 2.7-like n=1 Tax=Telopea speciosissima TaxID=54955 RepID=UPI001CC82CC5|nr:glutamate receptor 2.7-like [Telopea speciosissima]
MFDRAKDQKAPDELREISLRRKQRSAKGMKWGTTIYRWKERNEGTLPTVEIDRDQRYRKEKGFKKVVAKFQVLFSMNTAMDLIENVQVQAIIGPDNSGQAKFMADLGDKAQVPIVSFAATSPSLSSDLNPFFIRTAYNDSAQVKAIAAIVQAFGWREAVPVYENSEYGNGIIPYLVDNFEAINTRIPYRSVISPNASDDQILEELYKLMTMQTRVFVVHMLPSLGSRLFLKAKEVGMMSEGYVWIITDGLTNFLSSMDRSVIHSMEGVLGVKPHVQRSKKLDSFEVSWKKKFLQENPDTVNAKLDIYELWGYDTAWALAMAAEKVAGVNSSSQKSKLSLNISSVESLRVSQIGLELREEILNTQFEGLSGEFKLVDGQLQSSIFQIVNVIGRSEKDIGFWTPMNGLFHELNVTKTETYPSLNDKKLRTIIWPGDSTTVPKGWEIPTNEKKLKIGVPGKDVFTDFVNVQWDNTNASTVTGYCIQVFDAVMGALPYTVPYEYIPFAKADHTSAGTYNDIVYQVYLQKFDAVVGDITIIANRSLYVDFTQPYTESGVSMVVPIKDKYRKNAWVFLKPLSTDLWLTTAAFFVFTGFVIWALEHRINDDFRGPLHHQVGMIFWFSFSTMVFSHKEKVISNLARFILIIWLFVVLILTSSYTASLTSMLTVQQLQPTITDVQQLLKNGENVGYQEGSFVFGLLKLMNFDDSKLKVYSTAQELDDGLSKGTANGGFAAAFDEIPYLKLFLSQYCSNYSMVGPTYKTGGFGFVFPRGSPLVSDVSRAILNVTEGDKMTQIEKMWFGDTNCPDSSTTITSGSLTVKSFWGLFLITGTISFIAFLAFLIHFFWRYRNMWKNNDQKVTLRQRIGIMIEQFMRKDFECFTFRNRELQIQNTPDVMGATRSPSVISEHTNGNFDQATTSTGTAPPSPSNPIAEEISPTIELSNQVSSNESEIP